MCSHSVTLHLLSGFSISVKAVSTALTAPSTDVENLAASSQLKGYNNSYLHTGHCMPLVRCSGTCSEARHASTRLAIMVGWQAAAGASCLTLVLQFTLRRPQMASTSCLTACAVACRTSSERHLRAQYAPQQSVACQLPCSFLCDGAALAAQPCWPFASCICSQDNLRRDCCGIEHSSDLCSVPCWQ